MAEKKVEDVLKKFGNQLEQKNQEDLGPNYYAQTESSKEFVKFKQEMMPQLSKYERLCDKFGRIKGLKLSSKEEQAMQVNIDYAHLDITPSQVIGLALISGFFLFILGVLITAAIFFLTDTLSVLLIFLFLVGSGFVFYYFYTAPVRLSNQWRLKAGSQMVPCILYVVIYLKHTSNLERAIRFASQHLDPPLGLDLKKVFWDLETGKYSTIKASLDTYLETWRANAPEFVESFNLIESSLFEPSEARRVQILERALNVILEGVYDNMLKYTREVKAPLTNIYMLGIVLPTLALALIPLASALLGDTIKWYHIFVLFNLIIPFFVFYMTNGIMVKRPGGYGETSILELNPMYPQYKSKRPYWIAGLICFPLFLIGILPFIIHYTPLTDILGMKSDYSLADLGFGNGGDIKLFDYISGAGPMGIFSLVLSFFIPLSVFLFFALAYKMKTKEIIKMRDYSKVLEAEFNNSLFQLGNRIGDGTPAELAFGRVAESVRGQVTENFFKIVNSNIQGMGMSLEKAIFDSKRGAIISYPSALIATSMHILIESAKKGLTVAAQSLMSISDYVRNINKINDRLRDLLADVISDMRSNMTFLAPLLAGIVVGLGSMITLILGRLNSVVNTVGADNVAPMIGQISGLFKIENMVAPYFLQVCVGLYIIEVVFILTKALVTVDAGQDELKETYDTSRNLMSAGMMYLIVGLIASVVLSTVGIVSLAGITGMG